MVMYAGRAVERGTLKEVFDHPLHPYTKGLMASIPTMDSGKEPLHTIPGTVPTVYDFGPGLPVSPTAVSIARSAAASRAPGEAGGGRTSGTVLAEL